MMIQSQYGMVEIVEQILISRFVIVGHGLDESRRMYRAELPVCTFDLCTNGTLVSCAKPLTTHYGWQHSVGGKNSVNAWLEHCRTHCHNWHWPTVERFAREVLATYGAAPEFTSSPGGIARSKYRETDYVPR